MARRNRSRLALPVLAAAAPVLLSGCTLTETALVPEVDALVVEATYEWREAGESEMRVWVHRVLGPSRADALDVEVEVGLPGLQQTLSLTAVADSGTCVESAPEDVAGRCFLSVGGILDQVGPGDELTLSVRSADGDVVEGRTTVPGLHHIAGIPDGGRCTLPPDTPMTVRWSVSQGAWSYLNETLIYGIAAALAPQGIVVEEDPLPLLGLSISAQDTTVVFPGEFGVFQRGDLDQGVALALQRGLPRGTEAEVAIAAVDRNFVNWVRGGNFNPSGQVRVPSMTGDGTGYFGSAVLRQFRVVSLDEPTAGAPLCPLGGGPAT